MAMGELQTEPRDSTEMTLGVGEELGQLRNSLKPCCDVQKQKLDVYPIPINSEDLETAQPGFTRQNNVRQRLMPCYGFSFSRNDSKT